MADKMTEEYRAGLHRGELLVQRCNECSKITMYPKYACPHCQSEDLGWQKSTGKAVVKSFTVTRAVAPAGFEEDLPYALAVLELDEGVQLLGRLVPDSEGDWESYSCDESVEFVADGASGPEARPIAWFGKVRNVA